ncbi:hypothetical protein E2542_SST19133 [Spatholobus suberectus]|nr:hypothetical protein E2542_SST19133 [Spatholobus suberectus]
MKGKKAAEPKVNRAKKPTGQFWKKIMHQHTPPASPIPLLHPLLLVPLPKREDQMKVFQKREKEPDGSGDYSGGGVSSDSRLLRALMQRE